MERPGHPATEKEFVELFYPAVVANFLGSCQRLLTSSNPPAFALRVLLIDHLLLLRQEPTYLVLGERYSRAEKFRVWGSSLLDNDRRFLGLPDPDQVLNSHVEESAAGVVQIDGGGEFPCLAAIFLELPPKQGLQELAASTLSEGDEADGREAPAPERQTVAALLRHAQRFRARLRASEGVSDPNPTTDGARTLGDAPPLGSLDNRMARVLDGIEESIDQDDHTVNLFAVSRVPSVTGHRRCATPPGYEKGSRTAEYDYSARVFLSERHRKALLAQDEDKISPEEVMEPLGDNERSIADSPLESGQIDFSRPGEHLGDSNNPSTRQLYDTSSVDSQARKGGEDVLYDLVRSEGGAASVPVQPRIFYVPIHINDVPWAAVFRFETEDPTHHWRWKWTNFVLYSSIAPVLAEALSRSYQEAYIGALGQEAAKAYKDNIGGGEAFIRDLNVRWERISRGTPYAAPTLVDRRPEGAGVDARIELSDREDEVWLRPPSDQDRTRFRTVDWKLVARGVEESLRVQAFDSIFQFRNLLQVFGHYIGSIFRRSGIAGWHPESASESGIKSRLMAAWAIAAALRPLKYSDRGLPRDWFHPSFDPETFTIDRVDVLSHEIAEACIYFLQGAASISVEQRLGDGVRVRIVEGDHAREIGLAKFAKTGGLDLISPGPFVEVDGMAVGFLALSCGLGELIKNATDHLTGLYQDVRSHIRAGGDAVVLEIRVDIDASTNVVRVEVGNLAFLDDGIGARAQVGAVVPQDSVTKIQALEAKVFKGAKGAFVRTEPPTVRVADEENEWVVGEWRLEFSNFILASKPA